MRRDDEVGEEIEQSRRMLPKILFTLSRCRIIEGNDFRDLLSCSQMHVDKRDKVGLAAQ
jgi:hypothetical protein